MRTYILTEHERDIIQRFLNEGLKLNGFAVLRGRLKNYFDDLKRDMELIEKFLEYST